MSVTSIEWTDKTWNPVRGCTKISPGCTNCYASTFAERWRGIKGHPYEQGFDLRLVPEKLDEPLRWKKPRRVFVNSMSDLFHEDVPDEFIDKVFAVLAMAKRHTFQILTKRADRMLAYFSRPWNDVIVRVLQEHDARPLKDPWNWMSLFATQYRVTEQESAMGTEWAGRLPQSWPLPNVWLGVSVENQKYADERIPLLLQTPAAVRFLSCEPLLGPLEFSDVSGRADAVEQLGRRALSGIDWVIVGGESGRGSRPCNLDWIRAIRDQCKAAGIAVFVKQLGSHPVERVQTGPVDLTSRPAGAAITLRIGETCFIRIGETCFSRERWLRDSKGGDPSEWPDDLRVREFPGDRP